MTLTRRAALKGCLSLLLISAWPNLAPAQTEAETLNHCLDLIRACQRADGAFGMKAEAGPTWVNPYFANHAALALLAAHEKNANRADLAAVQKWLIWYAAHQDPTTGTINDFRGLPGRYQDLNKHDSVDSYAALFLLVAERHRHLSGNSPPAVQKAVRLAIKAIESVTDHDGLTFALPTYKVKFLMDNIETHAGLLAGARYLAWLGDRDQAATLSASAKKIAEQLPKYWQEREANFAYALHVNGVYEGGFDKAYPQGLANLFGLAFVSTANKDLWPRLTNTFKPESGLSPPAPVERWYLAALRVGSKDQRAEWRTQMLSEAAKFNRDNVYIHRPAVVALALLKGNEWMPSLLTPRP